MDPISIIVTAITAAAPLVGKELVSVAVKDAYAGLKAAIASRFKRGAAIAAVEEAPDSKAAHEGLAGALRETGAADDAQVRALAAQLIEAIRNLPESERTAAGIEIGPMDALGHAIVEGNWAAGSIKIDSMKAGVDAIVRNNRAGVDGPKNG